METCAVTERMRMVLEWAKGQLNKTELAEFFGVSRPTVDKWLGRYQRLGLDGMKDLSKAPSRHPNQIPLEICRRVMAFKHLHKNWGPRKLRAGLIRADGLACWPASSTIGDILRREGLSGRRQLRRRVPSYTEPFAACKEPNDVWCVDFKGHFRTADGCRCDPLTLTDAASRYLLTCRVMKNTGLEATQRVMREAFEEYGLPAAIRSDNGVPFAGQGVLGLTRLSLWWIKLGIKPERISPGSPQENGRHERFHLTLKQETASPPMGTLAAQQRRFDEFQLEYNRDRPHEALGQQSPGGIYVRSHRAYKPPPKEVEYPSGMLSRRVQEKGEFYWRSEGIFLSEALRRERIGLRQLNDRYWSVEFMHLHLGLLDGWRCCLVPRRKEAMLRASLDRCSASAALQQSNDPTEV